MCQFIKFVLFLFIVSKQLVMLNSSINMADEFHFLDDQLLPETPQYCNSSSPQQKFLFDAEASNCVVTGHGISATEDDYYSDPWMQYRSTFLIHRGKGLSPEIRSKDLKFDAINNLNLLRFFGNATNPEKNLRVLVFGGSFTAGVQAGGKTAAWPQRLQDLLNSDKCKLNSNCTKLAKFDIINHAEGGTTCQWAIRRLYSLLHPRDRFDMIIVDYDVNDCVNLENTDESRLKIQSCTEVLVRRVLMHRSHPALIFLNTATTHYGEMFNRLDCENWGRCWSIGEVRLPILKAYGVPTISQKTSLWSNFTCNVPAYIWPCSRFCSHPRDQAHKITAMILEGFFRGTSFCPPGSNSVSSPLSAMCGHQDDNMIVPHPYVQQLRLHNASFAVAGMMTSRDGGPTFEEGYYLNHTKELDDDHCHRPLVMVDDSVALERAGGQIDISKATYNASSKCWVYMEDVPGNNSTPHLCPLRQTLPLC